MALQSGSQIGVYQIVAPLGAGGMGEVYRARDTRLNRQVALKVLPETIARDHERVARFTREAQMLAALNHPNIAAIYGVEDTSSGPALVLEYVDGDTLTERINRGALPVDEVIRIALQIATALEAAHEKAVIHRDLKPANVKITSEGVVKVLDFGLAKALETDTPLASPQLSQSPTLSLSATGAGMILGTAGYMAPEQARGLTVDRRSDIWAFGVVLFEMLSSRPLFEGETIADTIANVLQRDPDWRQLPPQTPNGLRTLIKRCLVRNPKERLQAIGDARILLEEMQADPSAREATPERPAYPFWKKALPWAVAPLFLIAGYFVRPTAATPERPIRAFELPLSSMLLVHNYHHGVAVSPDGRRIAWVAAGQNPQIAPLRIYVRDLEHWDSVAIPGTENAQEVTFAPDGESIAFLQGQQLKKVALSGGAPVVVVERLNTGGVWGPPGISWGGNGTIVFPKSLGTGLSVVRENGGEPEDFTTLDTKANESSHRLPHFLPDGKTVLFTVLRYTNITPSWKRAQIWARTPNGERKLLLDDAMDAQYADGTLVFARQGKLFGVRFNPETLTMSGTPVQVLDNVTHALYGNAAVTWTGAAQYSLSSNGTLFYGPGSIEPPMYSALSWMDRTGKETPIEGMAKMSRFAPRVLPDGKRVAFSELHVGRDIRVFNTALGTEDPATFEGQNAFPIWSRDGSRMAFRSDRQGPLAIYLTSDANWRQVTPLTPGPQDVPSSWAPGDKELVFTRGFSATGGNTDIYMVAVDRPNDVKPLVNSSANEAFPEISPDGRWLAYISDESGRPQLYVQPYKGTGKRVTVTNEANVTEPAWSLNSNELFYRVDRSIVSVRYAPGADFTPERPVKLFDYRPAISGTSVRASYDVAPDGRFLVNQPVEALVAERNLQIFPASVRLVLNWTAGVQRLLSAK
jgi:serine/threonine-protein kinase